MPIYAPNVSVRRPGMLQPAFNQPRLQAGQAGPVGSLVLTPAQRLAQITQSGQDYTTKVNSLRQLLREQAQQRATNLDEQRTGDLTRSEYNRTLSGAPSGVQGQYDNPTYNQIAGWARQGGWAEKDIPMAIAIAMAESGGRPQASHRNADSHGSTDWGVWQINDYWHRDKGTPQQWQDPVQNARVAKRIFDDSGGNWTPWSTYKNNAYSKFLTQPSGTRTVPIQSFASTTLNGNIRANAINIATHAIGVPYVWGGNSLSNGVDCSGLVQQVYGSLGIKMPRTADEQSHQAIGTRTSIQNLRPGDLVAWQGGWRGPNYVGHIAIYAGNGEIIEAPYTGANVRRRALRQGENAFGVSLRFSGE